MTGFPILPERAKFSLLLILILYALGAKLPAQQVNTGDLSPGARDFIARAVQDAVGKGKAIGASFAIFNADRILMAGGAGWQDRENGITANENSMYVCGSITKLFTLTAILRLQQQGKLDIDRPLHDYLPEFHLREHFEHHDLTLRQVLTHHAGLPADHLHGCISEEPMHHSDLAENLHEDYLCFPPNTIHLYSNVGFSLLGDLIEHVTGEDYETYMEREILDGLEMEDAYFGRQHDRFPEKLAKGYDKGQGRLPYKMREIPAGGLVTSPLMLAKFGQMVLNAGKTKNGSEFLTKEWVDEMLNVQNAGIPLDYDMQIGLTWRVATESQFPGDTVKFAWHSGSVILYNGMFILSPDRKLGVAVLNNSAMKSDVANGLAWKILREAIRDREALQPYGIHAAPAEVSRVARFEPETLAALPGEWSTKYGWLHIRRRGKRLKARFLTFPLKLVPMSDDKAAMRLNLLGIPVKIRALNRFVFHADTVAGQPTLYTAPKENKSYFAVKFDPEPVPESWRKRLGKYAYTNLGPDLQILSHIRLREKRGVLFFSMKPSLYLNITLEMPLKVLDENEAVLIGYGRWQGETLRWAEEDGETVVYYSGYRLRLR